MAAEISQINAANLAREQNRLQQSELDLEQFLLRMLLFTLTLGVLVSALSIYRLSSLESRGAAQRERAERAEKQLRRLSHGLVKAQEEERKNISRELHDALGQKLSYIGMELGALDDHRSAGTAEIHARLEDIKRLVTESIRFVRDLSMTLRPAMLDELGLGSALRWQAREFARRTSIEVDVQLHGDLDGLPETHRINIYRVVQEGLTNCAKHSKAKTVRIGVYGDDTTVRLTIQDDGVGFDSSTPRRGLGLIGIEERVSELGGTLTITSTPGKGTLLEAQAPLHPVSTETPFPAPSQVVPS
jgi:signal transduction histidine kinase